MIQRLPDQTMGQQENRDQNTNNAELNDSGGASSISISTRRAFSETQFPTAVLTNAH